VAKGEMQEEKETKEARKRRGHRAKGRTYAQSVVGSLRNKKLVSVYWRRKETIGKGGGMDKSSRRKKGGSGTESAAMHTLGKGKLK